MTPRIRPCLLVLAALAAAGAAEESPARTALEQAAAAHALRVEAAREAAAWTTERQRLEALIAATRAETERLERAITAAERTRHDAEARLAALGNQVDLAALRLRLVEAGVQWSRGLAGLAATLPPGTLAVPAAVANEQAFDAAVRALEAAEHAAGTVAVAVVTGRRDGRAEAVKVLRVSGAAAWWVSLDGQSAGVVRPGGELAVTADPARRAAIIAALGQVEGRQPPAVMLLPAQATP